MKTVVVLSALAAIALAGPALPGNDLTEITTVGKRLERTPTLGHLSHHGGLGVLPVVHHTHVQPIIPHHLGLKKPILFKKNIGHGHHYRASDEDKSEEHSAESKESKDKCLKQMKEKCDEDASAKSSEPMAATAMQDVSDSDLAQSIQEAKAAVENLQLKLQKAEHNPKAQWKHGESQSDVQLHENVETAKQAIDLIQRNFGNLESMKLHATTFKDAEMVQDVHFELGKTEEERIAQWKDAMNNIQRNAEIAKNIQDSFQPNEHTETMKSASSADQNIEMKSETTQDDKISSIALKEDSHHDQKRTSGFADTKEQETKKENLSQKQEKSVQSDLSPLNNEMETSSSMLSESKMALHVEDENHQNSMRSEDSSSKLSSETTAKKNSEIILQKPSTLSSIDLGMNGNGKENKESGESTKTMKASELTEGKVFDKNSASDLHSVVQLEKNVPNAKLTDSMEGKTASAIDTTKLMKSADHQGSSTLLESHSDSEKQEKSSWKANEEQDMKLKNPASQMNDQDHIKSHMEHSRDSHFENPKALGSNLLEIPPSSDMDGKTGHATLKSADQMTGQSQQLEMAMHAADHATSGHHFDASSHIAPHGHHDRMKMQGKSADSDNAMLQRSQMGLSSMRSGLEMPRNNLMSWKGSHGPSRSAYGSGLSLGGSGSYGAAEYGGSGAVGVFPNAHVGGCAIPLLLSCSPSVVTGSLAKAHSSYAAPSYSAPGYRASEDSNVHTKRDILKSHIPTIKIKRTPFIRNYKPNPILV